VRSILSYKFRALLLLLLLGAVVLASSHVDHHPEHPGTCVLCQVASGNPGLAATPCSLLLPLQREEPAPVAFLPVVVHTPCLGHPEGRAPPRSTTV
jgi:hypothetical protein